MQTVLVTGPRRAELRQVADPVVKDNYALVKIHAAPLCTEYQAYAKGEQWPRLGHEAAGEVVAVGDRVARVNVGDRVVVMPQDGCGVCHLCRTGEHIHCANQRDPHAICDSPTGRGTYAQYVIQQDWLLLPIPAGMSYDHAAMACCGLGPTFNACRLTNLQAGETAVIGGLGAVGLGGVINATARGAQAIGLDPNPYRRDLALKLGATAALDPTTADVETDIRQVAGQDGPSVVIETANAPASVSFLAKIVRRKGRMGLVSWAGELKVPEIVGKGLSVSGAWHWNHLAYADEMMSLIRQNKPKLERFITHTFPLARVEEAWALQLTGQCGKVVLHPWA